MRHLLLLLPDFCCALAFAPALQAQNQRVFDYDGVKYVTAVPNEPPATPA